MTMFFLPFAKLEEALTLWNAAFSVFTAQNMSQTSVQSDNQKYTNHQDVHLSPYAAGKTLAHTQYTLTTHSPKEFVFAPREKLFSWQGKEHISVQDALLESFATDKDILLFGIRPCDAYGLAYSHAFFHGEYKDMNYARRQKHLYTIAVNCVQAGAGCFCASLGTGPFVTDKAQGGADVECTPLEQGYILQAHSEKGQWLLSNISEIVQRYYDDSPLKSKAEVLELCLQSFTRKPDFSTLQEALEAGFEHELWARMAPSCILCTGCTRVCPSCTCFTTHEELINESTGQEAGQRVRCWDSCQSRGFTRNAGWHEPRDEVSIVRYRIYDKLHYIEQRFGFKGCTGCGRCSAVCPAAIDIVQVAEELMQSHAQKSAEPSSEKVLFSRAVPFINHNRAFDAKLYVPEIVQIVDIFEEAKSVKRFTVKYVHNSAQGRPALRGQFYMITVFGAGEIAISVPFSDKEEQEFTFYVKKVGKVTSALFTKKVGDMLGLRGPYGVPFPYESFVGRSLLVVGSGVGHAPVRAPLVRAIENREQFKHIVVIGSAMTYEELLLKEDLQAWNQLDGVHVHYALARPTKALTTVPIHVGYINDLLPPLAQNPGIDWGQTSAIICASARRIQAVAKDLVKLGMQPSDIYTALETNMRCGVGKCGHCKVGAHYMCSDGPVLNYADMLSLPQEF